MAEPSAATGLAVAWAGAEGTGLPGTSPAGDGPPGPLASDAETVPIEGDMLISVEVVGDWRDILLEGSNGVTLMGDTLLM